MSCEQGYKAVRRVLASMAGTPSTVPPLSRLVACPPSGASASAGRPPVLPWTVGSQPLCQGRKWHADALRRVWGDVPEPVAKGLTDLAVGLFEMDAAQQLGAPVFWRPDSGQVIGQPDRIPAARLDAIREPVVDAIRRSLDRTGRNEPIDEFVDSILVAHDAFTEERLAKTIEGTNIGFPFPVTIEPTRYGPGGQAGPRRVEMMALHDDAAPVMFRYEDDEIRARAGNNDREDAQWQEGTLAEAIEFVRAHR